jgi:hypothetical protein
MLQHGSISSATNSIISYQQGANYVSGIPNHACIRHGAPHALTSLHIATDHLFRHTALSVTIQQYRPHCSQPPAQLSAPEPYLSAPSQLTRSELDFDSMLWIIQAEEIALYAYGKANVDDWSAKSHPCHMSIVDKVEVANDHKIQLDGCQHKTDLLISLFVRPTD